MLLDLMIPEPDDLEVARRIRRTAAGAAGTAATEERSPMATASRALLGELQRATLQAAGIARLLALVAADVVAFGTTRPVERLADVTRRYGTGARGLRAPTAGHSDVAGLGRVFNDTADHLPADEDLRQRVTTDVAYELRTPLTVLKRALEAIKDGPMDTAQLLQLVDLLALLVRDLQLLTLAEAGELTLHREPIDPAAVMGASR